jgi:hypothetical protein
VVRNDQHPALRDPLDAKDLGSKIAAVQQRSHCECVAAGFGVEPEGIVTYFVRMRLDARDPRVQVLPDHFFSYADDAIADGSHRLPQRGFPQQP